MASNLGKRRGYGRHWRMLSSQRTMHGEVKRKKFDLRLRSLYLWDSEGHETREFLEWPGLIMSLPDSLDQKSIMQTEAEKLGI